MLFSPVYCRCAQDGSTLVSCCDSLDTHYAENKTCGGIGGYGYPTHPPRSRMIASLLHFPLQCSVQRTETKTCTAGNLRDGNTDCRVASEERSVGEDVQNGGRQGQVLAKTSVGGEPTRRTAQERNGNGAICSHDQSTPIRGSRWRRGRPHGRQIGDESTKDLAAQSVAGRMGKVAA